MAAHTEMVRLSADVELKCQIEGPDDAPVVLMCNSHGTNFGIWDHAAAALRNRYRVLRYDQRGHGGSSPTPPPYTMIALVEDAAGLLDHFSIKQAHVIGVSMGGATTVGLATRHADRVASAIVCDSSVKARAGSSEWDERITIVRNGGIATLVEPTIGRWFTKASIAANTEAVKRVSEMIRTTSANGYIGCANALQTYDFSDGLEGIAVPCLFVAGAEDGERPKTMAVLAERVKGARFQAIAEAGHLPSIEQPAAFTAVVSEFLDKVTGRAAQKVAV